MTLNLALEELRLAEIYDFTLRDGLNTPLRLTHVTLPAIGGHTYAVVPIERTKMSLHTDLHVDTISISIASRAATIRGRTLREAVTLGWFDGADILIRAINPAVVTEQREIFRGTIGGGADITRREIKLHAVSALDMLRQTLPRNFFTEACGAQLYDHRCGLARASFRFTGTLGAGSTISRLLSPAFNANFVFGEVRMTAGANVNISRRIRTAAVGEATLSRPFDFAVATGEAFEAWWGCDQSWETCHARFNNVVQFRGFPMIPSPTVML